VLPRERTALRADAEQGQLAAAREVLDFARPRRWPFGSNAAAPADRDFLLDLLDERAEALARASEARLTAALEPLLARVDEGLGAVPAALRAAVTPAQVPAELGRPALLGPLHDLVYVPFQAFARGYLRGGRVDDFFTRTLPHLELSEPALYQALLRDLVDLEAELVRPLEQYVRRLCDGLAARVARLAAEVTLARVDLEERVFAPLESFEAALAEAT
jgi:hypothetical protein